MLQKQIQHTDFVEYLVNMLENSNKNDFKSNLNSLINTKNGIFLTNVHYDENDFNSYFILTKASNEK